MTRRIELSDYRPVWKAAFDRECRRLQVGLDPSVRIHHIGSTAVPGLLAKPTIDILVNLSGSFGFERLDRHMIRLGYVARGENGIPGRRYYTRGGTRRSHHVHAYLSGDPHIAEHLAFRDYLRAHPGAAAAYATVKWHAMASAAGDPQAYAASKGSFIVSTVRRSLAWAAERTGGPGVARLHSGGSA